MSSYSQKVQRGYQQLTVAATAVSLTVPAGGVNNALVRCSTADVRWRDDGAPTAAVGIPLLSGETLIYDGQPEDLQFIRQAATSATLDIGYYSA